MLPMRSAESLRSNSVGSCFFLLPLLAAFNSTFLVGIITMLPDYGLMNSGSQMRPLPLHAHIMEHIWCAVRTGCA